MLRGGIGGGFCRGWGRGGLGGLGSCVGGGMTEN
jgi:hypothetical protein